MAYLHKASDCFFFETLFRLIRNNYSSSWPVVKVWIKELKRIQPTKFRLYESDLEEGKWARDLRVVFIRVCVANGCIKSIARQKEWNSCDFFTVVANPVCVMKGNTGEKQFGRKIGTRTSDSLHRDFFLNCDIFFV